MKSINSAQGVESVKSTGKQWLARMTKKRCVAVVALSLCFVLSATLGLNAVWRSKSPMVENATTTVQRADAYAQLKSQMQGLQLNLKQMLAKQSDEQVLNETTVEQKYDDAFLVAGYCVGLGR